MSFRNIFDIVAQVDRDYPQLKFKSDGELVDQVAHRANLLDGVVVWGRKARQEGGVNPNNDALTYQNDPHDFSKKTIVDIIQNSETPQARVAWQAYEGDNPGNGYWMAPVHANLDTGGPVPPIPPVPPGAVDPIVQALRDINSTLQIINNTIRDKSIAATSRKKQ